VKAPDQTEFDEVESDAKPLTSSVIVVPVDVGSRINGEPAKTEHDGRFGFRAVAHVVFATPGPGAVRLKVTPANVINPILPTPGSVLSRSLTVPISPRVIVPDPPLKLSDVPAAAVMHPSPPRTGKIKSILEISTVTPPPLPQFANDRGPITDADADGSNIAEASKPRLKTATLSGKRLLNSFSPIVTTSFIFSSGV